MDHLVRPILVVLLVAIHLAFPLAVSAEPLPREVELAGYRGRVVAQPTSRHAEVTFDGLGTVAFDNARIVVKKDRISISARSADRTLYAWGNRYSGGGGIGMLTRSRARKARPQTHSAIVNRILVDGADGLTRR